MDEQLYKKIVLLEHITSRPKLKLIYRTGCAAGLTSKPHKALQCIKIKSLERLHQFSRIFYATGSNPSQITKGLIIK